MLRARAPAKLNLALHITGNREDGYHLIETFVVFTQLHDAIQVEAADALSLTTSGPFADAAGRAEDNLVLRAAKLLQEKTGCSKGAALTLDKQIPVGAGLGGGSSDAATTLRLLDQLWELNLGEEQLKAIGLELGADVPMFLFNKPCIARGIGEQISPLHADIPPLTAVLVYPNKPLSTADVYGMFTPDRAELSQLAPPGGDGLIDYLKHKTRNDLQRPAIALLPEVTEILLALEISHPTPLLARMSGSGSACFALFGDADRAAQLAGRLRNSYPRWWVAVSAITI